MKEEPGQDEAFEAAGVTRTEVQRLEPPGMLGRQRSDGCGEIKRVGRGTGSH